MQSVSDFPFALIVHRDPFSVRFEFADDFHHAPILLSWDIPFAASKAAIVPRSWLLPQASAILTKKPSLRRQRNCDKRHIAFSPWTGGAQADGQIESHQTSATVAEVHFPTSAMWSVPEQTSIARRKRSYSRGRINQEEITEDIAHCIWEIRVDRKNPQMARRSRKKP